MENLSDDENDDVPSVAEMLASITFAPSMSLSFFENSPSTINGGFWGQSAQSFVQQPRLNSQQSRFYTFNLVDNVVHGNDNEHDSEDVDNNGNEDDDSNFFTTAHGFRQAILSYERALNRVFSILRNVSPWGNNEMDRLRDTIHMSRSLADELCQLKKENFIEDWCSYFNSIEAENDGPSNAQDDPRACCVCYYDLTRHGHDPCKNNHFMCKTCLLEHYWQSTGALMKSFALCPVCRKSFTMCDFVT